MRIDAHFKLDHLLNAHWPIPLSQILTSQKLLPFMSRCIMNSTQTRPAQMISELQSSHVRFQAAHGQQHRRPSTSTGCFASVPQKTLQRRRAGVHMHASADSAAADRRTR